MPMSGLRILLTISFVLAFAGIVPWIVVGPLRTNRLSDQALGFSIYVIGPIWLILAAIVLLRYRRRGLWVLLGLPFALSGDAWLVVLIAACSRGNGCL
jgi:hypothetical protein